VISLLNLQIDDLKDPYDVRIFRESQNRIRSIALVHDSIYPTGDLSQIDFARYADILVRQLRQSFPGHLEHVSLRIDIPGVSIDMNKAITCGLILNELLSPALNRHAEGQGGEIYVGFHAAGPGKLMLEVQDRPVSYADSGTMHSDLVEVLVEQLDGSLSLDRTDGIRYTITFDA
jgi:two-component sensor histidine kinase